MAGRGKQGSKPSNRGGFGSGSGGWRSVGRRWFGLAFGGLVALCLAQVAWWIVFQLESAERLERLARAIETDDRDAALGAFDSASVPELLERADQQRSMFALEGATLGILVLLGVLFLYTALIRERRIREERTRFLTGATHELKTPLATIRLGLESIGRKSLSDEKRQKYLGGMLREADRLETGLTNLLIAGGLESSSRSAWQAEDLAIDLGRLLDSLETRARSQDLRIERHGFESCPVLRDRDALRIALHNVIDNAIKFSRPGETIDVTLSREQDRAVLQIRDHGYGIDPRELPRIFERFQRAGPDHLGGTGLGLALSREIFEQHGGSIRAESDGVDQGSRFTIELPIDQHFTERPTGVMTLREPRAATAQNEGATS